MDIIFYNTDICQCDYFNTEQTVTIWWLDRRPQLVLPMCLEHVTAQNPSVQLQLFITILA
jgi:hypothetical protein